VSSVAEAIVCSLFSLCCPIDAVKDVQHTHRRLICPTERAMLCYEISTAEDPVKCRPAVEADSGPAH
jgi:hypothetical protein